MLSTTNTEQLFGLACSGNIKALKEYWDGEGDLKNVTYERFGKEHSLIMGAFRNQQYDTVRWLKNHGCRLTDEEQDEINMEYMRIKTIELLANTSREHDDENVEEKETISFSIMEENHTRIGRIWIAKPEQELSKEDFAKVKQKLATLQGYYSISKNAFVFKYNPAEVL